MTYIGKLAEVAGADPTAGAAVWKYVSTDHLGSVRALRNESRTALAQYEYEYEPNTWAYVRGNPLNGVDPLGFECCQESVAQCIAP